MQIKLNVCLFIIYCERNAILLHILDGGCVVIDEN